MERRRAYACCWRGQFELCRPACRGTAQQCQLLNLWIMYAMAMTSQGFNKQIGCLKGPNVKGPRCHDVMKCNGNHSIAKLVCQQGSLMSGFHRHARPDISLQRQALKASLIDCSSPPRSRQHFVGLVFLALLLGAQKVKRRDDSASGDSARLRFKSDEPMSHKHVS